MDLLCDINPTHGAMKPEPMYEKDATTIRQYGWFCQVPECDGYGGPVERVKRVVSVKNKSAQLDMFEEIDNA